MQLRDRAKAVAFIEAYAPNESHNVGHNHALWTALDKIVEETPKNEQLLVLIDANARMPMPARGGWILEGGRWGTRITAYGRDALNDNGELLLPFATSHDLALVNKLFSTLKGGVAHDFNGRSKKV